MSILKALLMGLAFFATAASAVNIIDVEFSSLPGGKAEMRFLMDGKAPSEPKVYTIESPARIALDLQGVSSLLKKKKYTLDLGNAQSVIVIESGGRTRIIVNLLELAQYEARLEDNALVIIVGNDGVKDYLKETSAGFNEEVKDTGSNSVVESIDFRRGDNGEGRLIVQLSNSKIDIDSRVEGKLIKLSFLNTQLPDALHLKYDVSDFATPVQSILAVEEDGVTTLEILPIGEYDYLAYQTDNQYILTVKPLTKQEMEAKKKEFAYVGDRLSLNFQDIEIRAVLQLLADFTDLNLVASDTVNGKITLRLKNVPWDQALDLILKTKGLDKRQDGNVLLVAPAAEIARREQQEIQTNRQIEELAPLQTEFVRVRYAKASDIFNLLSGNVSTDDEDFSSESTGSLLSSRATVIVDERTNSLLVTETAAKLEDLRRLLELIDVPIRQVMIEARIVSATSTAAEALGVQWGGISFQSKGNGKAVIGISDTGAGLTTARNNLLTDPVGTTATTFGNVVNLGVGSAATTNFSVGFFRNHKLLNLQLSAMETSGTGEVVSQPKVITGDKQNAIIKNGQQIAFQESSASGGTTTAFKDASLVLDVTPSITPDDRIILDIKLNRNSIGTVAAGSNVPSINTTELITQVLVNNGETVVLGGIFETIETSGVSKTPFFGDLPFIGRLFRRNTHSFVKSEILIFITPRILADNLVE